MLLGSSSLLPSSRSKMIPVIFLTLDFSLASFWTLYKCPHALCILFWLFCSVVSLWDHLDSSRWWLFVHFIAVSCYIVWYHTLVMQAIFERIVLLVIWNSTIFIIPVCFFVCTYISFSFIHTQEWNFMVLEYLHLQFYYAISNSLPNRLYQFSLPSALSEVVVAAHSW